MSTASVDAIHQGQAFGSVASRMVANGMNANAMRPYVGKDGRSYISVYNNGVWKAEPSFNAALLQKDEWKNYDDAVLRASRNRLVGVADLESRGLVYSIGNGMGTTVLEYEDMNDPGEAAVDMDGINPGRNDRAEYSIKYLPLPITHSDFFLNARVLASSRTRGIPLDVSQAEAATRRVNEKLEDMLFTAYSFTFGEGTIYGYLNHPNRNQYTLAAHWNDSAASGTTILADVQGMIQMSIDAKHYGPWVLYVPTAFQTALGDDYQTGYPKTIRQRLLELEGLEDIKVADRLTADNVVLVQMSSDVVRMVNAMETMPVEWETIGGMRINYKIMCIKVPQIRADQSGNSGIVHGTK